MDGIIKGWDFPKILAILGMVTIWATMATGPEDKKLTAGERQTLFDILSSLPPPQFEQLLFVLNPPASAISTSGTASGQRTADLLRWAQGATGEGFTVIWDILEQSFGIQRPEPQTLSPKGTASPSSGADTRHQEQLAAKDEQIALHQRHNAEISELAKLAVSRPISNSVENKIVQGNDSSRSLSIGGDFNAGDGIVNINLGEISGQVSNQINQLPDAPSSNKTSSLKELLAQLKEAIDGESELSEDEKAEALGELAKLAKAGSKPKEGAMQRMAKRATNALKSIAEPLSNASKLATACKNLLPMIVSLF